MPLVQIRNASMAFGHIPLLDDANLVIDPHARLCLVGRNGAGKSTLLNVLSGRQVLDGGELQLDEGVRVAALAQEVPAGGSQTVYATVVDGLGEISELLADYHALSINLATGDDASLARLSRIQAEIERLGAWDVSHRVDSMLERLGLPADALMSQCSGGVRRRAMLAQALISKPDLLLLDEPTNHLDIASITALENALEEYAGAVLFITHDRAFMDALASRIIELDRSRLSSYPGSYAAYQKLKADQLRAETSSDAQFDKRLQEEEVWIRQGIKARRTRNEGRVRRLQAMRQARQERLEQQGQANMSLKQARNSGKVVLEASAVSFGFDGAKIVADFSTTILRGDRVGLIGPNGSGKTTLLKLLLGELVPDSGVVRRGTQLDVAYFDQERAQLNMRRSVRDNVADGSDQIQLGDKTQHVIGYLRNFLFSPERANSPVSSLSGGERNRLLLAKLFAHPANLLVMDEPTNDLDVETLELLEELLLSFEGTLLLVSHDRAFLDRTVTSTLVLEGEGRVGEYVGGYSDWKRMTDAQAPGP